MITMDLITIRSLGVHVTERLNTARYQFESVPLETGSKE